MLLQAADYGLQANRTPREGEQHPDRKAQFAHIAAKTRAFLRRRQPVISVDTKTGSPISERTPAGSVGVDHDMPEFAVQSIQQWWRKMGRHRHPAATDLLIIADATPKTPYRPPLDSTQQSSGICRDSSTVGPVRRRR